MLPCDIYKGSSMSKVKIGKDIHFLILPFCRGFVKFPLKLFSKTLGGNVGVKCMILWLHMPEFQQVQCIFKQTTNLLSHAIHHEVLQHLERSTVSVS